MFTNYTLLAFSLLGLGLLLLTILVIDLRFKTKRTKRRMLALDDLQEKSVKRMEYYINQRFDNLENSRNTVMAHFVSSLKENQAKFLLFSSQIAELSERTKRISAKCNQIGIQQETLTPKLSSWTESNDKLELELKNKLGAFEQGQLSFQGSINHAIEKVNKELLDQSSEIIQNVKLVTETTKQQIESLTKRLSETSKDSEAIHESFIKHKDATNANLKRIESNLLYSENRNISQVLYFTLRAMRSAWLLPGIKNEQEEVEHGQQLMISIISLKYHRELSSLKNKTLIEIGTTRERQDAVQSSTEKFAVFTSLLGIRFCTVDMDPNNTEKTKPILQRLNPKAEAIAQKGEEFLGDWEGQLDFVYLDAFDVPHNNHSKQRIEAYKKNLDTEITDESCWEMHLACAKQVQKKMSQGGIIVFDDTTQKNNSFTGKGKLAIPYLLDKGFSIVGKSKNAIGLQRDNG